jgi:hypothetical protein
LSPAPHRAVSCRPAPCRDAPPRAAQCSAVPRHAAPPSATPHRTVPRPAPPRATCPTVMHRAAPYRTVPCTVPHRSAPYRNVPHPAPSRAVPCWCITAPSGAVPRHPAMLGGCLIDAHRGSARRGGAGKELESRTGPLRFRSLRSWRILVHTTKNSTPPATAILPARLAKRPVPRLAVPAKGMQHVHEPVQPASRMCKTRMRGILLHLLETHNMCNASRAKHTTFEVMEKSRNSKRLALTACFHVFPSAQGVGAQARHLARSDMRGSI